MSVVFKVVTLGDHKLILLLLPESKIFWNSSFRTAVRKSLWATLENQSCYIVFTPHSFPQTSPRWNPQPWLQVTVSCFQKSNSPSKTKSCLRICKTVSHRLWRKFQWGSSQITQVNAALLKWEQFLRRVSLESNSTWILVFWDVKWKQMTALWWLEWWLYDHTSNIRLCFYLKE
jgi:hypothetical protein